MAAAVGGSAGGLRRSTRPPAPAARYDRRAGGAAAASGKPGSRGSGRVISACDEIDEPPDDREAHVLLKLPEHLADQLRERLRAEADPEVAVVFSGAGASRWRRGGRRRLQPGLTFRSAPLARECPPRRRPARVGARWRHHPAGRAVRPAVHHRDAPDV